MASAQAGQKHNKKVPEAVLYPQKYRKRELPEV